MPSLTKAELDGLTKATNEFLTNGQDNFTRKEKDYHKEV
jgi:hypothetical protein